MLRRKLSIKSGAKGQYWKGPIESLAEWNEAHSRQGNKEESILAPNTSLDFIIEMASR